MFSIANAVFLKDRLLLILKSGMKQRDTEGHCGLMEVSLALDSCHSALLLICALLDLD